jgi:hypothetical protein
MSGGLVGPGCEQPGLNVVECNRPTVRPGGCIKGGPRSHVVIAGQHSCLAPPGDTRAGPDPPQAALVNIWLSEDAAWEASRRFRNHRLMQLRHLSTAHGQVARPMMHASGQLTST